MKKILLTLSACALLITSCGDGKMSATEYNEKVIALYNPLQMRLNKMADGMDGNAAEMTASLDAMSKSVDSVRTEVSKLQPNEDAQELHTSMMQLLDFEKDKMLPRMKAIVTQMDNPEKVETATAEINALTEEVTVLENKMTTAQEVMAAKAGAKLH